MEIPENRRWMYQRLDANKRLTVEFVNGVAEFLEFATNQEKFQMQHNMMRCPCEKCKCKVFKYVKEVVWHLNNKGFMPNYYWWTNHGELEPQFTRVVPEGSYYESGEQREELNCYKQMIMDHVGPSIGQHIQHEGVIGLEGMDENPNPEAQEFFEMLAAAQTPLWEGCENHSELSASLASLSLKSDYNMSEGCFNRMVQLMGETMPKENRMVKNFYQAKKSVRKLGLGCLKIDCCPNGCMVYYNENSDKSITKCNICEMDRYKIINRRGIEKKIAIKKMWYFPLIPRLKRLYSSMATASHMRWHNEKQRDSTVLCHPSDGQAWKHFDKVHPEFSQDPRNVRLGLCADGFNPFGQYGKTYSCWPVILTPYNLPPAMCMKREFMFLTVIIPGPSNPKYKIDVYLQPLIDELCTLWNDGILTYDVSLRQNFMMKAALMRTINDFPAYGMLSGWSTAGKLGCPICMERSKAFSLKNSHKVSYFDCHRQFLPLNHPYRRNKTAFRNRFVETSPIPIRLSGPEIWNKVADFPLAHDRAEENLPGYGVRHNWTKQSIFWRLPYWITHLLPHNIDVMHTERNVFMNVFDTVMDIKGRTKDTNNSRLDLAEICNRKELELKDVGGRKLIKPKATYALTKSQRVAVCLWVKELKLPDGYASNLGRCVDINQGKLHGMKSHDCHVFMQRLLPIAFDSLPKPIWKALVELSNFFRELTSTTLNVEQVRVMEDNIPVLLCKLEQIFPPSFFDSMEHLPIHLPYEAIVGGPVQYRWMYLFERFLHSLKNKVKNKAKVEASICEAYLVEETSTFASYYYPAEIETRRTRMPRNLDADEGSSSTPPISIFNYPGKAIGKSITYFLDQLDLKAAHLYVLLNCEEIEPYLDIYTDFLRELNPTASEFEINQDISSNFPTWFKEYVLNGENNIQDSLLLNLAWGPKTKVESWPIYIVNGYKFHTVLWGQGMDSSNCGVCVRGTNGQLESDFYGKLTDIIQLEYIGLPIMKLILFKCDWFDNTPNIGTRVNNKYGIVEVRQSRRYNKAYDPFIFAQQAEQVYYTTYPEGHQGWLAVIKTKARGRITDTSQTEQEVPYQDDDLVGLQVVLHIDADVIADSLADAEGGGEEVDIELLDQTNLDENIEDTYISSEGETEIESDFNDTDTT